MTDLKIRCGRDELLAGIQAADAVVPSNSAKPILTNLLLDALDGRLEVVATDMQVGLRSVLRRVEITSPGQAVVQARQLAGILKESGSATVQIHLERRAEHSQMQIHLADGEYQIPAVIGETYPAVGYFPADVPTITLSALRLEEMIRQTIFGIDRDRTSAVLSGLLMGVGNGEIALVGTDGKVLCEAVETSDTAAYPEPVQAIIPAATISHIHRILLATRPEQVQCAFANKLVFVRFLLAANDAMQVELTSRLVEGNFPSYRNALPERSPNRVAFNAGELSSAVRRTALMTNTSSRGIVLALDHDQAVLSNLNYTNGSARIPVGCTYQGAAQRIGLNAQYLGEVLKVYKGSTVDLELGRALIVREPGITFLIMPISLPT